MKNYYLLCVLFLISSVGVAQITENVLENGNFHECNEAWELGGNFYFTYDCTGEFIHYNFSYGYMYNLQVDDAYDTMFQYMSFPDNIEEVELELYHKISTEEVDNNTVYDEFRIELVSGSDTYEVDVLSNEDYSNNYVHKSLRLRKKGIRASIKSF